VGIHERLHGLLQEERIPLGPLDEERREPLEPGALAEQPPEELLGTLGWQRVEAELTVVGLAAPAVLILGAIVDQEAQPGCREARDEGVEEHLSLGVDPVEILEHEEHRLAPRLLE
jgi:hypothetical protein